MISNAVVAAVVDTGASHRAYRVDTPDDHIIRNASPERRGFQIESTHSPVRRQSANSLLRERYGWRGYQCVGLPEDPSRSHFSLSATRDGETITLGRGGSDLSAIALAAALGAAECRIFTDVDGIYTTEPRVVPEARKIDTEYLDGPFRHLRSTWAFRDVPGGCEVDFHVDFEFRNAILQGIIGVVFNEAMQRIVRAFERRAAELYGPGPI